MSKQYIPKWFRRLKKHLGRDDGSGIPLPGCEEAVEHCARFTTARAAWEAWPEDLVQDMTFLLIEIDEEATERILARINSDWAEHLLQTFAPSYSDQLRRFIHAARVFADENWTSDSVSAYMDARYDLPLRWSDLPSPDDRRVYKAIVLKHCPGVLLAKYL